MKNEGRALPAPDRSNESSSSAIQAFLRMSRATKAVPPINQITLNLMPSGLIGIPTPIDALYRFIARQNYVYALSLLPSENASHQKRRQSGTITATTPYRYRYLYPAGISVNLFFSLLPKKSGLTTLLHDFYAKFDTRAKQLNTTATSPGIKSSITDSDCRPHRGSSDDEHSIRSHRSFAHDA